jgi:hypothetical protein
MIGPVSETGKVMLSSLQGAMSKGMPVDQAITYVKSMAQQGVAPLVDLYSLLKQFERMKQPPASMPQGGTVKDQLSNLESAMAGGLGGMQPGAMSAAPQMQGLASLDAGRMENPQGFAGGGIVAFAEGGQPEERKSITPELYTLPQSYEELAKQRAAEAARLKTAEGRAALEAEIDADMKARGLGKYAPSLGMREAYAERKGKEAEALAGEEAALNEESFWADVAGTDQPDLVSALAKSKAKAVERKRTTKDKVAAAKDKAEDLKILRQEAREALANKDYETYKTKMEQAKTLSETSTSDYLKDKTARERAATAAANARQYAREMRDTPLNRQLEKIESMPIFNEDGTPNEEILIEIQRLNMMRGTKTGTTPAERLAKTEFEDAKRALEKAIAADDGSLGAKDRIAEAERKKADALNKLREISLGQVSFGVPQTGTPTTPSATPDLSGMSDEEVLAALGSS